MVQADTISWIVDEFQLSQLEASRMVRRLMQQDLIYRVGVLDFRLVHHSHASAWQIVSSAAVKPTSESRSSSHSNQIKFLARFWKDPFGQLDRRVMFSYLSGVLAHVMAHPGIRQEQVIAHFGICLPPTQTLEILEMLTQTKCIEMTELETHSQIRLFSSARPVTQHYYESTPQAFIGICQIRNLLAC
jgi:hypothetical protein